MKFPVQVMAHSLYEGNAEPKVSYDISLAGTTVEGVSQDEAKTLMRLLQNLLQSDRKEASHE
jgi:hypothetical protein